jgi:alpha-L-fucosidase
MMFIAILLGSSVSVLGLNEDPASGKQSPANLEATRASLQEDFLKLQFGLFLHFNMATYVNREWANGYEDPKIFKPERLDCNQWAES